PIYEGPGGELNAGSVESATASGESGGSGGVGLGSVTEEDETETTGGEDGSSSGGTSSSSSSSGSAEGSSSSSSVDDASSNTGSSQQGQGQGDRADDGLEGLKKALASERTARKAAEKEIRELRLKNASAEERAILEAKEAAAAETETKVKGPLVRALAAAELRAANVQGPTARLVGLLDLDKVEIDDDGEAVGLVEQIENLKAEFPNLFQIAAASGGRAPAGNSNGGSGAREGRTQDKGGDSKPKPWNVVLAEQVLGAQGIAPGVVTR
ncbi:MAG: phage scaffolding protein, partial [Acidimicrobiales bacterium]